MSGRMRDYCIARDTAMPEILSNGEILGLGDDGRLILWDAAKGETYSNGLTPEEFGLDAIGFLERDRLERDGWTAPAPARELALAR